MVRRLVRYGCDIDARSERNRTALHMAVWNNRPRIVRFLLRSHCSLNVRDRYGDTALMLSARRGFPEIMYLTSRLASIMRTCYMSSDLSANEQRRCQLSRYRLAVSRNIPPWQQLT